MILHAKNFRLFRRSKLPTTTIRARVSFRRSKRACDDGATTWTRARAFARARDSVMTCEIGGDGVPRRQLRETMRGNPSSIHSGSTRRLARRRRRCNAACATWVFACVSALLFALARAQRWVRATRGDRPLIRHERSSTAEPFLHRRRTRKSRVYDD